MIFNDKGLAVRNMQLCLLDLGFALPRFGADGHLGDETMSAVKDYTGAMSIEWKTHEVPQRALDVLLSGAKEPEVPPVSPREHQDVKLYDLRDEPWKLRNPRKFKRVKGKPLVREPSMVTGITVHQTAVKYGTAAYQVHAAGGDRELALAHRSLGVACHVMAFHDGFIAWTNPLSWYVYHGNGFNAYELGIEIDGNYPGLVRGNTWNGRAATVATVELIHAARAGVELLVHEGRKMGMPIEYIHAHRQSSDRRRADPGEELWKRVVLEYAVAELGLKTEPTEVIGGGRPIPKDWDDEGLGPY